MFENATSEVFLKLVVEINAIGDSNNKDEVANLLDVFFKDTDGSSWVQITGAIDDGMSTSDHESGESHTDLSTTYAHLLDGFLGSDRGKLNRLSNYRDKDLRDRGLEFSLDDINFRIISGHTVAIGGDFTDSDTDEEPKDVDLTVIASGRDTTLTGNSLKLTDTSAPNVTDAFVIASADELYLRAEWNAETHAEHYRDPEPYTIDVENASLALASVDTMHLINVDITTQGSLALATLDDLNIRSTRGDDPNVFDVGNEGVRNEGLFLYAKNDLSISDLEVRGKVDDIYMEAHTINLKNVTFPAMSAVLLRSQLGGMTFDGESTQAGRVNFRNVKHLGVDSVNRLNSSHFNGNKTWATSSSGRARVEVQALGSGN